MAKPVDVAQIAKALKYFKDPSAWYAGGSAALGVGVMANKSLYPEYYAAMHNGQKPNSDFMTVRSVASTGKHIATVMSGIGAVDVKHMGTVGKVADMANLYLQYQNLKDALNNEGGHRTSSDQQAALFAFFGTVSANLGNAVGSIPQVKDTKAGKEFKLGMQALNLLFNAGSAWSEDPHIMEEMMKALADPAQFAKDFRGFMDASSKAIAEQVFGKGGLQLVLDSSAAWGSNPRLLDELVAQFKAEPEKFALDLSDYLKDAGRSLGGALVDEAKAWGSIAANLFKEGVNATGQAIDSKGMANAQTAGQSAFAILKEIVNGLPLFPTELGNGELPAGLVPPKNTTPTGSSGTTKKPEDTRSIEVIKAEALSRMKSAGNALTRLPGEALDAVKDPKKFGSDVNGFLDETSKKLAESIFGKEGLQAILDSSAAWGSKPTLLKDFIADFKRNPEQFALDLSNYLKDTGAVLGSKLLDNAKQLGSLAADIFKESVNELGKLLESKGMAKADSAFVAAVALITETFEGMPLFPTELGKSELLNPAKNDVPAIDLQPANKKDTSTVPDGTKTNATKTSTAKTLSELSFGGRAVVELQPTGKKIPVLQPDWKKIPVIYPDAVKVRLSNDLLTKTLSEQGVGGRMTIPNKDTRSIEPVNADALSRKNLDAIADANASNSQKTASPPKASDLLSHDTNLDSLLGRSTAMPAQTEPHTQTFNSKSIANILAKELKNMVSFYDSHF